MACVRRRHRRSGAPEDSEEQQRDYVARPGLSLDFGEMPARGNRVHNEDLAREQNREAARKLIDKLQHVVYDQAFIDNDEFGLRECAICMDEFEIGSVVDRIPLCKHFFHPECCKKWFESKIQASEKKCPLCNKVITEQELKDAQRK